MPQQLTKCFNKYLEKEKANDSRYVETASDGQVSSCTFVAWPQDPFLECPFPSLLAALFFVEKPGIINVSMVQAILSLSQARQYSLRVATIRLKYILGQRQETPGR